MAAAVAELVVRIITDAKNAASGMDEVGTKAGKMQQGISKAAAPAAAALLAVGAAAISAGRAAAEDAQSQAVLAKNLENSAGATKAQIAATEEYIGKMALATGVADDKLRPAMSNLVLATKDTAKAQDALGVALDVSAATGKDVESVSQALAKGYAGNTTSLGRLIPSLDKATLASGDMDAIMAELAKTTGGAAAASADTAAGKMDRMNVAMGEAQEAIGAALLPAMAKLAEVLGVVATFAAEHPALFQAIAAVIVAVSVAILALNVAMKVLTITTAIMGNTAARAWVMAFLPVAGVIVAVGLVIAIVVLLWKRCETFRTIVLAVWNAVKSTVVAVAGAIRTAWNTTMDAITGAARTTSEIIRAVWAGIREAWANTLAIIRGAWQATTGAIREGAGAVREVVANAFRTVRDIVVPIFGAIREAWGNMVGAIKGAVAGMAAILAAPFNAVKGAIDAASNAVQTLIGWLGRIKVPSINLPNIPGFNMMQATTPAGLAAAPQVAAAPGQRAVQPTGGINITVNGALDPEATARQIRRILAGHDRRMGLVAT
jgi:uncharacterized protein YjbJ (UPF0337 family)